MIDELIQSAVLYRLETLAESASKLPDEVRRRNPHMPWRDISDFRNRVSHGYLDLDLDLIWRVIVVDLPALKDIVQEELEQGSSG